MITLQKGKGFFSFLLTILRGIGQIMLQESPVTGIFFLAGIFVGSPEMGLVVILSTLVGTLTAKVLKYPQKEIQSGLYGFSPALVGVALLLFFNPGVFVWLFVIIGSTVAAVVQRFFIKRKIPAFTLPFVLVTWCLLYILPHGLSLPLIAGENLPKEFFPEFLSFFRGYGQVIFQGSILSGILFFIGVLLYSPISAVYGLLGGLLGGFLSALFSVPTSEIAMGLFSFNGVLCGIALAGKKFSDVFWAVLAVFISVVISWVFTQNHLPQLTFPFVAGAFLTLMIKRYVEKTKTIGKP